MKNYNKMSDFEINKAVGAATGDATGAEPALNLVICNSNGRSFDPCNSWNDAGTVIRSIGISIVKSSNEDGKWFAISPFLGEKLKRLSALDINPLRAAMIVFLLMMDAEENYELA